MCRTGTRHCRGKRTATQRSIENAQRRVTRNAGKAQSARDQGDEAKALLYDRLVAAARTELEDHSPASIGQAPVEVYDSSGSPCEVTPGVIDDEADWVYLNGQCLALAVAMSERTGWPVHLRTLTDGDEADPTGVYANLRHAYVQAPDGALIDIRGVNDADIVDEECRDLDCDLYLPPRVIPAAEARTLLDEFEGYLFDQDVPTAETFVDAVLARAAEG